MNGGTIILPEVTKEARLRDKNLGATIQTISAIYLLLAFLFLLLWASFTIDYTCNGKDIAHELNVHTV